MRHERRTMGTDGECHKVGKAATTFVLSGVIIAAGGTTTMAAGSAGAGTAAGTAVNLAGQGPGIPAASKVEPEEKKATMGNEVIQPQNLEGAKDADQLVVVVGVGGCNTDVYHRKKSSEAWEMVWKEAGIVGRNRTADQETKEDGGTPSDTYGFTMAFGFGENPGSVLSCHKIARDDYWVDDSASPCRNKLVNTSQAVKTWNSAEDMAATSPYCNYALVLNYNRACEPERGSVIFLHCFIAVRDNRSAGCIRLPQERVKELVQSAIEHTKIVVASDLEWLNQFRKAVLLKQFHKAEAGALSMRPYHSS